LPPRAGQVAPLPDVVDAETRSRMMAAIKGKNTRPEMILRQGLHARGLRYRLHIPNLPGRPDMVFPSRRATLFAHGCFWHGHNCPAFRPPATRTEFWLAKIERNREVDARSTKALLEGGWRVGIVWECALKGRGRLPIAAILETCVTWIKGEAEFLEISGVFKEPARPAMP
jgi:DNA mismatch endonuclease (patch repair protein)